MNLLKRVAIEDLFLAINSNSLDDITPLLNQYAKTTLEKYVGSYRVDNFKHKKSQSILASFTEGPSLPYYLLGIILGTIGLAFVPLLIYLGIFTIVMFGIGGIHSVGTYTETCEQEEKSSKDMQFMLFRLTCVNEIRRRLRIGLRKAGIKYQNNSLKIHTPHAGIGTENDIVPNLNLLADENSPLLIRPNNNIKTKQPSILPSLKDSIAPAMVMAIMIAESFLVPLFLIIKLAAAATFLTLLTNPFVLGATLLVIAGLCAYLGYKHYQHNKQKRIFQTKSIDLQIKLNKKITECYEMKELLDNRPSQRKINNHSISRKHKHEQTHKINPFNIRRQHPSLMTNPSPLFKKQTRFFYKLRSGLNNKRDFAIPKP